VPSHHSQSHLLFIPSWTSVLSEDKIFNDLYMVDLEKGVSSSMLIPLGLSHEVLPQYINNNWALVIERSGPGACLVDTKSTSVVREYQSLDGYYFSGHASVTPCTKYVIVTEYNPRSPQDSIVVIRDIKTWEVIKSLKTPFAHPHDICWYKDKTHFALSHYGDDPGFADKDVGSGISVFSYPELALVKTYRFSDDLNTRLCHIALDDQDNIFVGCTNYIELAGDKNDQIRQNRLTIEESRRQGFISSHKHQKTALVHINTKDDQVSFDYLPNLPRPLMAATSISYNSQNDVAAIVYLKSQLIIFVRGKDQQLLGYHDFADEIPAGLALSKDEKFFICSTLSSNIYYFHTQSLKVSDIKNFPMRNMKGNIHIYI
jgi:hypothetical protein